ncbi:protealysin inhibitor emfourin [Micromonospora sp. NPDC006766]|uniref:protealysin inhibitor emfourin n=1 Tax=Micromonospora sp. NPDC006766 TaxID=3154778 RepID=UPI0033E93906
MSQRRWPEPNGPAVRPIGMRSTLAAAATAAVLLVTLTGCAQTAPTSSGPGIAPVATSTAPTPAATDHPPTATGPAPAVRVELATTGGLIGRQDTVTVEPDGNWTKADDGGNSRTGRLSAADLDRLRRLAADPRLATEPVRTASTTCADAFTYRLTVNGTTTGYVDCPDDALPPATAALIELLTEATS